MSELLDILMFCIGAVILIAYSILFVYMMNYEYERIQRITKNEI